MNWLAGLVPKDNDEASEYVSVGRQVASRSKGNTKAVLEVLAERPFGATKGQIACLTGLTDAQIQEVFRAKMPHTVVSEVRYFIHKNVE